MPQLHAPMRNTPDNHPLACFLTFTTYGTWLHGDERGSVDHATASFDAPVLNPNPMRHAAMRRNLEGQPVVLGARLRSEIEAAIRQTCDAKGWTLEAINVRTNHVHVVVAAMVVPERLLTTLKAWATRRCREAGLIGPREKLWTRHGSTRYLWTERDIETACEYVLYGQGDDLPWRGQSAPG